MGKSARFLFLIVSFFSRSIYFYLPLLHVSGTFNITNINTALHFVPYSRRFSLPASSPHPHIRQCRPCDNIPAVHFQARLQYSMDHSQSFYQKKIQYCLVSYHYIPSNPGTKRSSTERVAPCEVLKRPSQPPYF